jgi:DNA repair protein RadC
LNSDDIFKVMQEILLREEKIDQEKEHLWMVGQDTDSRILYIEMVFLGTVKTVPVEPMNIFRVAVLKGATQVIIVHNHPSNNLQPSQADKKMTDRLIQVGRILNIKVFDHMIITTHSYLSFSETGLLTELEKSVEWVPQFELIERIKAEEKLIREHALKFEREKAKTDKEKAVKKKAIEIAKAGLKKGLTIEMISDLTGLTIAEIEKIK